MGKLPAEVVISDKSSFTTCMKQVAGIQAFGLRRQVMHKTRQLVHQKEGTPLDGVFALVHE